MVQAAPTDIAATLSAAALAGSKSSGFAITLSKIIAMTAKSKSILVAAAAIAVIAAIPLTIQQHELSALRAQLAANDASVAKARASKSAAAVHSPLEAIARINQILKSNKTET